MDWSFDNVTVVFSGGYISTETIVSNFTYIYCIYKNVYLILDNAYSGPISDNFLGQQNSY